MTTTTKIFHWIPRIIGILMTLFIGMFALDAFDPKTFNTGTNPEFPGSTGSSICCISHSTYRLAPQNPWKYESQFNLTTCFRGKTKLGFLRTENLVLRQEYYFSPLNPFICSSRTWIRSSASDFFFLSAATTFSGAPLTNFSLPSFESTDLRNPFV